MKGFIEPTVGRINIEVWRNTFTINESLRGECMLLEDDDLDDLIAALQAHKANRNINELVA